MADKLRSITLDGQAILCPPGKTLWQTLASHSDLHFACAGTGKCGKCKVTVLSTPPAPTEAETALLSKEELSQGIRLACNLAWVEGLTLQSVMPAQAQFHIATGDDHIAVTSPLFTTYGIAIDIGTTTLVATLYGKTGQLAKVSMQNPQHQYGGDVISRIEVHLKDRTILQTLIKNAINDMIAQLCTAISPQEVDAIVITGNTTMLYILTGRDVSSLSHAPFEADHLFGDMTTGKALDLIVAQAKVYLPQCICAFVGADIVTAILASDMTEKSETSLLMDIGTNGEIALFHEGKLTCCATAAGPAFEGGEISQGMSAVAGAISAVEWQAGKFALTTIGDGQPIGLCGSGLIDAVAVLLMLEAIDETGALDMDVLEALGILAEKDGKPAVQIAPTVLLTGGDVRKIQLAKGAISAGAKTLIEANGLTVDAVKTVYIAGGFGSFLNVNSACQMGLFPPCPIETYKVIGNAALDGAAMMLCNQATLDFPLLPTIGIDLSTVPAFTNHYMECMMFL